MAYVSSGQPCGKLIYKEVFVSCKSSVNQGINIILTTDKVLCYSREYNNEETYRGPEFVGLWIFSMVG